MPRCWIIAGPNGAGKTTFAMDFLPNAVNCHNFINADLIAAGLSPLALEQNLLTASRIFLNKIKENIINQKDFAFETTLSGKSYLKLIKRLRDEGWQIELIYLALPSIEMSKLRVAERVFHGGHNIPTKDIERRFSRSLKNLLNEFSCIVSNTRCYMNKGKKIELIFEQKDKKRTIINDDYYKLIVKEAKL